LQASALAGVKPESSALHAATLKQRERVIDEFNPTALEKMPPGELAKQVSSLRRRRNSPPELVAQSEGA
jgi:hypothetical protein